MGPAFPLLCLHEEVKPYCYLVEDSHELAHCNLTGYHDLQHNPELYFDAAGRKFRRKLKLKRNFGRWQKVLSYFYWGIITVESEWYTTGDYSFEDLRTHVEFCVQADDDILTQFIETGHLISLVKQARHFEDLYMILNGAIYNCEDDDSLED